MSDIGNVREVVLARVRPSDDERRRVHALAEVLISRLAGEAGRRRIPCSPMLVGSVAKGTWLDPADLDIFLKFPPETPRETLEREGLALARSVLPGGEERYAEHPYLHGVVEGVEVDLVPCYAIDSPDMRMSAVDRTPFHTEYVLKNLDPSLKDEVLLLKRFMKGVGVYGAEARVQGFSGYVVELLIMRYGGFTEVLDAASRWRPGTRISLHRSGHDVFGKFAGAPLVLIDPVDQGRNAAAAVSLDALAVFTHAAREALERLTPEFFFPRERVPPDIDTLRGRLQQRGTHLLALRTDRPSLVDDVLYPQVRKCLTAVRTDLQKEGFEVIRARESCNCEVTLLFELDRDVLPAVVRHTGPPVWHPNARAFLTRWRSVGVVPRIEGGRWVVNAPRTLRRPEDVALRTLRTGPIGKDLKRIPLEMWRVSTDVEPELLELVDELFDDRMPWER